MFETFEKVAANTIKEMRGALVAISQDATYTAGPRDTNLTGYNMAEALRLRDQLVHLINMNIDAAAGKGKR